MNTPIPFDSETSSTFFGLEAHWLRIGLLLLFVLAGLIRLYNIDSPGVLVDREFTSAIFARDFYFRQLDSVPQWQKDIATITKDRQPVLEPPVTDYLVSLIYRVIGSEQLWAAHLLTITFWLIGGIFFYQIARMVVSTEAAVIATGYYLFAPLGILVSRSFQPDALMMMLFLISLFGILKYYQHPSLPSLLFAGAMTGLTLLCRPLVLFALFGAFTTLAIYRRKSWKFALEKDYLIYVGVSLLPSLMYYGYGIFVAGYMRWKLDTSFRPDLYVHREYWDGWIRLAAGQIGYPILLGALLGLPMVRKGFSRAFLIGLWVGYLFFGLVFTMHIHTHGYYQAQLIPTVALSLGALIAAYLDRFRMMENRWYWWVPVTAALLIFLYIDLSAARESLGSQAFESPQIAQEIGELVNHSSRTVFVSRFYGMPLQYYGQFSGTRWPKAIEYWLYRVPGERELTLEERLNGFGYEPEYFIITDFKQFNDRYTDLKAYLHEQCTLLVQNEQYLIYDGNCTQ